MMMIVPQTSTATTDLDWTQVAADAREAMTILTKTFMLDSYPWTHSWALSGSSQPRLEELALRLESYSRHMIPPLRRSIKVGTSADRLAARDPVLRILRYAKQQLIEQELHGGPYPLSSLHPLVWTSEIRTQWRIGKRRLALQEAAHSIELVLQSKSGSGLDGNKLNNECFGGPHLLQVPGYPRTDPRWEGVQKSTRSLGEAVFTAVRNPSVHGHGDPPWPAAFELLALASAYARLVEVSARSAHPPQESRL